MKNPGHRNRNLEECVQAACSDCFSVVDFGCGFGKWLALANKPRMLGLDAYVPYIEVAQREVPSATFIRADIPYFADQLLDRSFDVVFMLDFLEHLHEQGAESAIRNAKRIAALRVIAFVPFGDHPQTQDVTGYEGHYWQTHRTTWHVEDLAKHNFDVALWERWHKDPLKDHRAMFAIWEPGFDG